MKSPFDTLAIIFMLVIMCHAIGRNNTQTLNAIENLKQEIIVLKAMNQVKEID